MQHNNSMPCWAKYMRIVKDKDEVHVVRPDTEDFLDFCFEYFELWIWSCYNLTKSQRIIETCFPRHYQKIKMFMGNKNCQNSNIMIGYKRVYHKKLSLVWKMFDDLDAGNTLIFYDTSYRVMWNKPGNYLIFLKMWTQTPDHLQRFLVRIIIPWLCGWLIAKNKMSYTRNTIVNTLHDPETEYHVMNVYLSTRKDLDLDSEDD